MYKKALISISLGTLILFSGCQKDKKSQDTIQTQKTIKEEYLLTSIDGKKLDIIRQENGFKLKDSDKIVLFDIYATWCPPCRRSTIMLSALQKKFDKDLVVVGLSIEDDMDDERLKDFSKDFKADYFLTSSPQRSELIKDIVNELGVGPKHPIPLMVLYKDAKLINFYKGLVLEEFIQSDIKNSLEEK